MKGNSQQDGVRWELIMGFDLRLGARGEEVHSYRKVVVGANT